MSSALLDSLREKVDNNLSDALSRVRQHNGGVSARVFAKASFNLSEKRQEIPENSELAMYLEQYPDAVLKYTGVHGGGWVTTLPEEKYSQQMIFAQRVKIWSKDGKFLPMIKSVQKEM